MQERLVHQRKRRVLNPYYKYIARQIVNVSKPIRTTKLLYQASTLILTWYIAWSNLLLEQQTSAIAHGFIKKNRPFFSPEEQTTPASWLWSQFCFPQPLWRHSVNDLSSPVHFTSSIHIVPFPRPKVADTCAFTAGPYPSSLQTTLASVRSHESSHTVPQFPL